MKSKRAPSERSDGRRRRGGAERSRPRRPADTPARSERPRSGTGGAPTREQRAPKSGPKTTPIVRPTGRPAPAKSTSQAKARAKARKAKAPKIVRTPLRERLIVRLASVDLRPRTLAAKVPFVVLVIGSLGVGLAVTLWLSTYSAERSYELGGARDTNQALMQQKEALERDVLEAQAAPALAEAARNLGMIPSKDTAHLVQDPAGNWVVVGTPKPAEGVPPPPLNSKLPDEVPADARPTGINAVEVPVRIDRRPPVAAQPAGPEVLVRTPTGGQAPALVEGTPHGAALAPAEPDAAAPGTAALPMPAETGPAPGPAPGELPAGPPLPGLPAPVEPVAPALPATPGAPA